MTEKAAPECTVHMTKTSANCIAALEAKLAKVREERDAALADAERYRWLRQQNSQEVCTQCGYDGIELRTGKLLDATIDAARKEGDK